MKFAIDIHGVIDENTKFFRHMCKSLMSGGIEVHILTGKHISNGVLDELSRLGFLKGTHYTTLFSMADFHKERGTKMWGDKKNPWMDDQVWNNTKALYCRVNNIDFCIDDKEAYMRDFLTPVALYKSHTIKAAKHLTNDSKISIIEGEDNHAKKEYS